MPELVRYQKWENAAKRWKNLLYNQLVSSILEYFINNLKNSGKILDRIAGGFLKSRFRKKMDQNEKSLLQGEVSEQIGCEWMFRILKGKYKERPGEAIMRLMAQLVDISQLVYQELEEGAQDPEGVRGWLSKKRDDLQSLGRVGQ